MRNDTANATQSGSNAIAAPPKALKTWSKPRLEAIPLASARRGISTVYDGLGNHRSGH
jgi:hypothetical protein